MARVPEAREYNPYIIDKFQGLWIQSETGNSRLPVGYASNMTNFYITKALKLKKTEGYKQIFDSVNSEIRTIWNGLVDGISTTLFVAGGNVYEITFGDPSTHTVIGTITDDETNIFGFDGRAYIINGNEYKYYDGTTFGDVTDIAYAPKIYVAQAPDRTGGQELENLNLLTGKRRETFISDGTSLDYVLATGDIDEVVEVKVNGSVVTNYTSNLTAGTITFDTAPTETGGDNVEITYRKGTGSPSDVLNNKYYLIYGGDNDTRVFLYGDSDNQHLVHYSGLGDSLPTATYFPTNSFIALGSENTPVKDMVTLNTRFIAYKSEQTYIGYYSVTQDTEDGRNIVTYPTKPLTRVKTEPYNQVRVCNSLPYSLGADDIYVLESTYIRDERNLKGIGRRIKRDLQDIDLSRAKTYDWEDRKWFMIFYDQWVWIYDYEMDTYSRLYLADNVTSIAEINKKLYIGTDTGYIMEFDLNERQFNGVTINSNWESGYMSFKAPEMKKNLRSFYITMFPKNKSELEVSLKATPKSPQTVRKIEYVNLDFNDVDFSDYSFSTNYDPTPFNVRIKAKKFSFLKLVLENNADRDAIVLGVRLPITFAGKFK